VQYTSACNLGTAGNCDGDLNVGGYTFGVSVMNDSVNQVKLVVDLNDTNAAGTVESKIVTKGGAILDLGTAPTTARRGVVASPTTLTVTTLAENFDENVLNEVISFKRVKCCRHTRLECT